MKFFFFFIFLFFFALQSCSKKTVPNPVITSTSNEEKTEKILYTGAENFDYYRSLLKNEKVGIVTNPSGILSKLHHKFRHHDSFDQPKSIVDFLIENNINVTTIYAPEHGFRGNADAGEVIKDGKDIATGLPIISLYGSNKKPTPEQLQDVSIMVFDLQDVGVRFYTYISSLHFLMEACAEQNIPLIVLDRPNPNGHIIDGPILEPKHQSFVGMHPVPVLHGMTIGEYAKMINGEKWLKDGIQCDLTVVPCKNYNHHINYSLPVRPSPNLPNDLSINLYASLCFFEGTNVSVGRGTEKQFQIFGSPFLKNYMFEFVPKPNLGAKNPLHNGLVCYGKDLSEARFVYRLNLEWLIEAYQNTEDQTVFFTSFFEKLAGTDTLRSQIESGKTAEEISATWKQDLEIFKTIRKKYLIYKH